MASPRELFLQAEKLKQDLIDAERDIEIAKKQISEQTRQRPYNIPYIRVLRARLRQASWERVEVIAALNNIDDTFY